MRRYENHHRLLAIGLAVIAGFVDALGFLELRGMFVSFMSGNSTRLSVGAATPVHGSLFAGALIAAFVLGVMAGTATGLRAGKWRKQWVLALVTVLLTLACLLELPVDQTVVPTLLMATAMGAANTVFQREGEVSVGVTYMTGTLVKIGQHLTLAFSGGPRFAWFPYMLLWIGLVVGAMAGAAAFTRFGLRGLWIADALAVVALIGSIRIGPVRSSGK
ncbi:MAG TPA: YoaK family protein [Sphingomonas sp.]|jgi:uncharacterized membrane protein YoaK (UPF0700 family)|nr:YoaK family protein [Sphingomonas sp.]